MYYGQNCWSQGVLYNRGSTVCMSTDKTYTESQCLVHILPGPCIFDIYTPSLLSYTSAFCTHIYTKP